MAAYIKAGQVPVHLLEHEVQLPIPGLDCVHALPELASVPHILTKGGTDFHELVANLWKRPQGKARSCAAARE